MSEAMGKLRRRSLLWLGGAALVSIGMGGASMIPPAPPKRRAEAGALVRPEFAGQAKDVALVMVTTKDEFYHLVKDPEGWVLPEKGRYPVRADRIEALVNTLSTLRYDRAMTRDDKKFDRIGLGDPNEGGTGALLEIGDGRGNSFAKLIVGYRDGRTYVREPDDLQAWATVGGEMPPLQRGARWLDLDAASVKPEEIADVTVRTGLSTYKLLPADPAGSAFQLAPPHSKLTAAGFGLTLVAQAMTRFSPVDVAIAADAGPGEGAALHITRTKAGLEIVARAWRKRDRAYVGLVASTLPGSSPEAAAQAAAINKRVGGWAFQLTETDWGAFATPLDALAMR